MTRGNDTPNGGRVKMSKRHKRLTEFNGFIYVDPDVVENAYAVADPDSPPCRGRVYVHKLGKLFATVSEKPDSSQYSLMRTRIIADQKDLRPRTVSAIEVQDA